MVRAGCRYNNNYLNLLYNANELCSKCGDIVLLIKNTLLSPEYPVFSNVKFTLWCLAVLRHQWCSCLTQTPTQPMGEPLSCFLIGQRIQGRESTYTHSSSRQKFKSSIWFKNWVSRGETKVLQWNMENIMKLSLKAIELISNNIILIRIQSIKPVQFIFLQSQFIIC